MLGQFSRDLDEKLLDNEQPYRWLKFGDIKEETERFCTFTLLSMQKTRLQNDSQMVYTRARAHTHTHTHAICEHEDVTVFCNPGEHTDREVMAYRPDIIKTKKRRHAH